MHLPAQGNATILDVPPQHQENEHSENTLNALHR